MKLLDRYSRINVMATIIIYIAVSFAFYFLFNTILLRLIDQDLRVERNEIKANLQRHGKLPELFLERNQIIQYQSIAQPLNKEAYTSINSRVVKKPYRKLSFGVLVGTQPYEVRILKPLEDKNQLLKIILQVTLTAFAIVLLINFFINRTFTRRLWKPFYDTLARVNEFELHKSKTVNFSPSKITEFQVMNRSFEDILYKARKDYTLLKEFTENASHELQTPLSIIRSKLDLLVQEEGLTQKQLRFAQGAYDGVQRLARLNNSLLLLMKIENGQFAQKEVINLRQKLEEKLDDFEELLAAKSLSIVKVVDDMTLQINSVLCEILLNNMLSNAIEHNTVSGIIKIELSRGLLTVSNTGYLPGALNQEKLFKRFINSDAQTRRNGLGLAIVKEICDRSAIALGYTFNNGFHTFSFILE